MRRRRLSSILQMRAEASRRRNWPPLFLPGTTYAGNVAMLLAPPPPYVHERVRTAMKIIELRRFLRVRHGTEEEELSSPAPNERRFNSWPLPRFFVSVASKRL